jgi:hypothetical protein
MDFKEVLNNLDYQTKKWATELTAHDISHILSAIYRIPGIIDSLKTPIYVPSQLNGQSIQSSDVGKLGESLFEEICQKLPINYKIVNTSKSGHTGDFVIEFNKECKLYRCLVDIKTYKSTVPKKEIDKFVNDMIYGSYDSGLMISYKSKFVGISNSIYIDDRTLPYGKVPIMFLSNLSETLITQCIEVLCTKMSVEIDSKTNLTQIENSISFINTALCQSSTVRRLLSDLQTNTSNQIQRCQEQLIGCEVHVKQAIRQMKKEVIRLNGQGSASNTYEQSYNYPEIPIDDVTKPTMVKSVLNTCLTDIKCKDLPNPPDYNSRINNIDDIIITTTDNEFPLVDIKTRLNTDDVANDKDTFNYSKYTIKDMAFIQQLTEFNWLTILQDENGNASFNSSFIIIHVKPLKTKTKVEIYKYEIDENNKNVPTDILELFSIKNEKYIMNLSQKLIDIIHKYFA